MVVAKSSAKTPARAASVAALAGPAATVNKAGQTLRLKHACLATACSDPSCKLCINSALRACSTDLKPKYVAGGALQAPCGAWPVLELLGFRQADNAIKFEVKVELIDEVKYQQVDPAGSAPTTEQLQGCLASDAGLKYRGNQGATAILPVKDGLANLDGLHIYKVPGGRSGHSTFYRLLFTVVTTESNPQTKKTTAAPAATLLTDKVQLVTTRSRSNEKSCVLQGDEPVKRVLAVGDGFAKVLGSLKEYVPEVPETLAAVTKVKEFHELVQWVKLSSNTSVPSLFRPNDWARASKHVLSALFEEDTRQRLWFPSVNGAGLLFGCQQGDPKLDSPAAFVLMLGEKLVARPTSQLGVVQLQQLLQKAIADWKVAGHPNWSIYEAAAAAPAAAAGARAAVVDQATSGAAGSSDRDAGPTECKQAGGCCLSAATTSKTGALSKPAAALARTALAAAFGGLSAGGVAAEALNSRAKVKIARRQAAATPAAASAANNVRVSTAQAGQANGDSSDTVSSCAVSPLSESMVQTSSATRALAAAAAASVSVADMHSKVGSFPDRGLQTESAAVKQASAANPTTSTMMPVASAASLGKRQQEFQQDGNESEQPPVKKLCSEEHACDDLLVAALPAAAPVLMCEQEELQVGDMLLGHVWQQQGMEEEQSVGFEPMQYSVFNNWCMDLDAPDCSDDLASCGSFWQELEEQQQQQQQRMLSEDPEEVSALQQVMLMSEDAGEAADLRLVYEYMCQEWCSELDAELENDLGSSFLCELQQMQLGLENDLMQNQQQAQGVDGKDAGPACELQTTMSRLLSLSDLPDVLEGGGATVAAWSQVFDKLPAVVM